MSEFDDVFDFFADSLGPESEPESIKKPTKKPDFSHAGEHREIDLSKKPWNDPIPEPAIEDKTEKMLQQDLQADRIELWQHLRKSWTSRKKELCEAIIDSAVKGNVAAQKMIIETLTSPLGFVNFQVPDKEYLNTKDVRKIQKRIMKLVGDDLIDPKKAKDLIASTNQMLEGIHQGDLIKRVDRLHAEVAEKKDRKSRADLIALNLARAKDRENERKKFDKKS